MRARSFSRYSDRELLRRLASLVTRDRITTATLIACIAECDARKLYLPAGYPSMYAYCVHELGLSEDAAYKRIQASRVAKRFPALLEALAKGRLHLAGVCLLAPYLTEENAESLLASAAHLTKAQIEELLAKRFPRLEVLAMVQELPSRSASEGMVEPAAGQVDGPERVGLGEPPMELAPGQVGTRFKPVPIADGRSVVQFMIGRDTQDKVRYAQELLGQLPSGDLAQMFDLALDALVEKLETRKFAATRKPRAVGTMPTETSPQRPTANPRYIPRYVKRAVWKRDGAQCTLVSESGRRCPARTPLEFDHVTEVARGGLATVEGLRLRCRAHNQYGAECTFGAAFMRRKREESRRATETRRQEAAARAADQVRQEKEVRREMEAKARAAAEEVITPLRLLGFRADEARRAAALCESIPDATLEERVRHALSHLAPRARSVSATA